MRPAPTSPARPTISPGRTSKVTSVELPAPGQVLDRSSGGTRRPAARLERGGKTYSIERPVISRMSSEVGVVLASQAGGDGAAVLEHGDPVADLADLLEPVRDVDDGDARRR